MILVAYTIAIALVTYLFFALFGSAGVDFPPAEGHGVGRWSGG